MEERKIELMPLMLLEYIRSLKIPVHYEQDSDGSIVCWTENLTAHGQGKTYEECREDLLKGLREFASFYMEDLGDWYTHNPDLLVYVLKVICSTDSELLDA